MRKMGEESRGGGRTGQRLKMELEIKKEFGSQRVNEKYVTLVMISKKVNVLL